MSRLLALKNFRIVDETTDLRGAVIVEDGRIAEIIPVPDTFPENIEGEKRLNRFCAGAGMVLDGLFFSGQSPHNAAELPVLMPAFVDLHAHFRDPGFPEKETLESACLAAAAGGYGTAVCMANTKPVTGAGAQAAALHRRAAALGLIDLYPALSLTKNMEGRELSEITRLPGPAPEDGGFRVRLLSEDGKDLADDGLFLAACAEARRAGIPVSCHCDLGGENAATRRAIAMAASSLCHIHIAHVSTKEAAAMIREAKSRPAGSLNISCEVTPHHLALVKEDADALGAESRGRVNPPLRGEEDRLALIGAVAEGTVDAIATDHAPHTEKDKEAGAPGFTGLETAFAVCYSTLGAFGVGLSKLSSLMSAAPARILGLAGGGEGRGRIAPGLRADFCIADTGRAWTVDPAAFKSRGKNSPFAGRELRGAVLMTIHGGRIVFDGRDNV
ncbi:MAG: amidohydrolase family protein [Spirochaetaceae bacterium]|jgi:dihydroorotase|nr:amidohydrolase family protein [Spirochaetaceae bacterium]